MPFAAFRKLPGLQYMIRLS